MRVITIAVVNLCVVTACAQRVGAQVVGRYDPDRLGAYSNTDLISFFSTGSITLNVGQQAGIVYMFPPLFLRPNHPGSLGDRAATGGSIEIAAPDTALAYLEGIVTELARRKPYADVFRSLDTSSDPVQVRWIAEVLGRLRGAQADSGLERFALYGSGEDDKTYVALVYFAQAGSTWALQRLNCNYQRWPVSSLDRAQLSLLFGLHKYYPAAPNLALGLDAASLNLVEASMSSLLALFPDGRSDFASPQEAKAYWMSYLSKHQCKGC